MPVRTPDYYARFRCTASAYTDNCCIGWEIDIDASTLAKYNAVQGDFGARLRQNIAQSVTPHFILQGERCPFLNAQNLCDIFKKLGENSLCEICTQHPRFYEWFDDTTEIGLGLCCEAAATLVFENEQPTAFVTKGESGAENPLLSLRDAAMCLVQDRRFSIADRMAKLLAFGDAVQRSLEKGVLPTAPQIPDNLCRPQFSDAEVFAAFEALLLFYETLEPIDAGWRPRLAQLRAQLPQLLAQRAAFDAFYAPRSYEYEHFLVYFLYRYFMKAAADGDVLGKVQMAVASAAVVRLLDIECFVRTGDFTFGNRVSVAKSYSKEIEYSEKNLAALAEAFFENSAFSVKNLLALL